MTCNSGLGLLGQVVDFGFGGVLDIESGSTRNSAAEPNFNKLLPIQTVECPCDGDGLVLLGQGPNVCRRTFIL